jgi:hypothetical protein
MRQVQKQPNFVKDNTNNKKRKLFVEIKENLKWICDKWKSLVTWNKELFGWSRRSCENKQWIWERERERERERSVYVWCMNEGDGGCTLYCIEWGQKGKESGREGKSTTVSFFYLMSINIPLLLSLPCFSLVCSLVNCFFIYWKTSYSLSK